MWLCIVIHVYILYASVVTKEEYLPEVQLMVYDQKHLLASVNQYRGN